MMSILLRILALALALPALVPAFLTLLSRRRRLQGDPPKEAQRLLFLIPAHDEEEMIGDCVRSLRGMTYPADRIRIVVIADNCSDHTAQRARQAGAEVLERHDLSQRGKPWALAWAIKQQDLSTLDAVVVVDADTVVEPGFAQAVHASGPLRNSAAQAYFATLNADDNWLTLLAAVLARARYEVTYVARERAGLNCPLTGNGMVFGAALLEGRGWTAFSLTENWEYFASLTAEGVPIRYVRDAKLLSQEVRQLSQGVSQRRRWILGRRETLRRWFRPLLLSPKISLAQKVDAILELAMPSPMVFMAMAMMIAVLGVALVGGTMGLVIVLIALCSQLPLGLAVLTVLVDHPEPFHVLAAAALLPAYAAWRLAVSIGTRTGRSRIGWHRTRRNAPVS
jgi:cellulose synthase/poly-beta-1,6-N-acetylglucosamine synthase-like glycosyltransferase